jgi:hypothetical protein
MSLVLVNLIPLFYCDVLAINYNNFNHHTTTMLFDLFLATNRLLNLSLIITKMLPEKINML